MEKAHWADLPCSVCDRVPSTLLAEDTASEAPSEHDTNIESSEVADRTENAQGSESPGVVAGPAESLSDSPPHDAQSLETLLGPDAPNAPPVVTKAKKGRGKGRKAPLDPNAKAGLKKKAEPKAKAEPNKKAGPKPKAKPKAKKPNSDPKGTLPKKRRTTKSEAGQKQGPSIAELLAGNGAEANGDNSETEVSEASEAAELEESKVVMKPCMLCNELFDKDTMINVAKRKDNWRCDQCSSSRTLLYRAGEIPDTSFMSKEDAHEFWEQCKSLPASGKVALLGQHRSNTKVDETMNVEEEMGQFTPIGVLQNQGYDVERMKTHSLPENIREDSVLGLCIRPVLTTVGTKKRYGNTFQDTVNVGPSEAPAGAGSSIEDLIAARKDEAKMRKEEQKAIASAVKKALGPAKKTLSQLSDLKDNLKATTPKTMVEALSNTIADLKGAKASLEGGQTDSETIGNLDAKVIVGVRVLKAMRAFS